MDYCYIVNSIFIPFRRDSAGGQNNTTPLLLFSYCFDYNRPAFHVFLSAIFATRETSEKLISYTVVYSRYTFNSHIFFSNSVEGKKIRRREKQMTPRKDPLSTRFRPVFLFFFISLRRLGPSYSNDMHPSRHDGSDCSLYIPHHVTFSPSFSAWEIFAHKFFSLSRFLQ